jgi:hypothetical protein
LGLIERLKTSGEEASARARETLQEGKLRQGLVDAYAALGSEVYGLVREGQLADSRLDAATERIRELEDQLARATGGRIR